MRRCRGARAQVRPEDRGGQHNRRGGPWAGRSDFAQGQLERTVRIYSEESAATEGGPT